MGEGPHDPPAADDSGPRPRRPRPATGDRARPAARGGSRARTATPRPAANRAAGNRSVGSRAAVGSTAGRRPPARTGRPPSGTGATRAASGARPDDRAPAESPSRRPSGASARPRPSAPGPGPRSGPSRTTLITVLSVLTVVVVSLVVYAFILRPSEGSGGQAVTTGPTTTLDPDAPGTTLPDSQFANYTSEAQGFSIRHPKEWQALDDEGGLLLDAGGGDVVSVRLVQRTEVPTTVDNLANIKAFTDGLVGSNRTAVILKQQTIVVDGMPGYYYLYTFTDEETGGQGVHAHYFLFRGRNMYTMIFQALPSDGFPGLSRVFDQIAISFRTEPDTGPAPASTAPAAPPAG